LEASISGKLSPFVAKLREHKVLYACPDHLTAFLQKNISADTITIPSKNMYLSLDSIRSDVLAKIEDYDIFCISGGLPAKVLLYQLWFEQGIQQKTLLDIGSLFDGYVGRHSRSHTKKLTAKIIKSNLS